MSTPSWLELILIVAVGSIVLACLVVLVIYGN